MGSSVGNAVASGVSNIIGDFGNSINSAMKGDWKAAGKSAFSGVSKLSSAVSDILTAPAKQVAEGVKSVVTGVIEVGQAVGYAMEGDWEAAGKSALSGVTNVIGGATSVALVASTVLVAFNPVAAAVVAGYAMYGGIAESGLGLAQNVVGQMTNDTNYAKKGSAHLVGGALKAFTANRIKTLANKKIALNKEKQLLKEEIQKQSDQTDKLNNKVVEDKVTLEKGSGSKRLYRAMSEQELKAVQETGKLRGGIEGRTYFTDSYFRNANNAQSKLSLPFKPEYIMEFEITNNPIISGGNSVVAAYNGVGGAREYFSLDAINVDIVNFQKMIP